MSFLDSVQSTARHADRVEFCAFQKSYASFDEGLVDEVISGEAESLMLTEVDNHEVEDYAKLDVYNDNQQGRIMDEIQKRSKLLGDLYPFDLKQSSLHYISSSSSNSKIYETLLLISLTTNRQGKDWLNLVASFEKLSGWVTKYYFQCSKAWWTGADGSKKFKEMIKKIYDETGELEWNPDENFLSRIRNVKDAGLDFINYRNLIDQRAGGLFFFIQSACGDDWFAKTQRDLRTKSLEKLFRQPYADPVKIFTIPYLLTSNHEKMLEAAGNISGLVFDRARLTSLLFDMENDKKVTKEIRNIYQLANKDCN